jgi:hypothetical protein
MDWGRIYLEAMTATAYMLGTPIFEPKPFDLANLLETWVAIPIQNAGEQAKAYDTLSQLLPASVSWLQTRDDFLLTEIVRYVSFFDRLAFARPNSIEEIRAEVEGERDWTIYRWHNPFLAIAELSGPNPMHAKIPIGNLSSDLRPLGAGNEPLIGLFKVPGGIFSRYEVWFRERGFSGGENPWFALNFLEPRLGESSLDRQETQQFVALAQQQLTEEDIDDWADHVAMEFQDLKHARFITVREELIERQDPVAFLQHPRFQTQPAASPSKDLQRHIPKARMEHAP